MTSVTFEMGEEETEKHVCCDCKKTKKRHKIAGLFRLRRIEKVEEEEVKENGEVTTVEKKESTEEEAAAGRGIAKRASTLFWKVKRGEVDVSEKTTEQGTEEEELSGKESLKTEEKTAGFFWNIKREASVAEKAAKPASEEELNEDLKTIDMATEVIKDTKKNVLGNKYVWEQVFMMCTMENGWKNDYDVQVGSVSCSSSGIGTASSRQSSHRSRGRAPLEISAQVFTEIIVKVLDYEGVLLLVHPFFLNKRNFGFFCKPMFSLTSAL